MKRTLNILKNISVIGLTSFTVAISTSCNKPIIATKMMYGNVITLDKNNKRAEAIGIKDGKIAYVGSKEEAKNHINDSTEIINYENSYIYPGFVDAHSHPAMLGSVITGGCLVTPDMNAEQTLEVFREYIINHPDQKIYKCYGSYAGLKNGDSAYHYTYKLLDEKLGDVISDDTMIIIIDYGGHSGCLNTVGINRLKQQFAITSADEVRRLNMMDTIELEDVDGDGIEEISGNISETPAYTFYYAIPCEVEKIKEGILFQQEAVLAKMGYTTVADCAVQYKDTPSIVALSELGAEGKLKFKIRAYYLIMETDNISAKDQIKFALDLAKRYNNEYFKIIGIKVFIDGVNEKESCYTTVPYVKPPADYKTYNGVFRWSKQWRPIMKNAPSVHDLIMEANRNGLSVTAHAYGDAAVKFMLDEYETARKEVKYDRNSISHCAYVLDEDVHRFKDLHVAPLVAPHWSIRTVLADIHDKNIFGDYDPTNPNARSIQKLYKVKTFINADEDNHVSFHTDGMCPEGVPYMLYTALNRVDPANAIPTAQGYIGPRDANEDVTISEALKCMTANPAYLLGEESDIGSIELNKSADFSIYPIDFTNSNTFKQENYEVVHTKAIATYVNGNIAYLAE